jgi:lipoprotein-releasing system permease protein
MRSTLFVLKRYLWPRQGNFLAFALWISVAGVALGIIQLIVVLSVMSGFQHFLQQSYTNITSEIVVIPRRSQIYDPSFMPKLASVPGVAAVSPFGISQAMIIKKGFGGVTLEGVDLATTDKVTPWKQVWIKEPDKTVQEKNPYWIWIGVQLANKLKVVPGDTVNVFLAERGRKKIIPFLVTAITKFGIYDHDLHFARIDFRVFRELFKNDESEPMYKVRLSDKASIQQTTDRISEVVGQNVTVRQWQEMNQNLFRAVEHQKEMLFLILEIVVALAAINVINLLMMSSNQRRRDIAILRAMGLRLRSVFLFFLLQGAAVGVVGIVIGIGFGIVSCRIIERFQPAILNESIYNVTRLPLQTDLRDVSVVALVALLLCLVFSIVPAVRATLMRPVKALRYE